MAERGLIERVTMQGFADEVRRLTETTDTGTPAQMLAKLQAFDGSGAEFFTASITAASNNNTLQTGIVFPETKNYVLITIAPRVSTAVDAGYLYASLRRYIPDIDSDTTLTYYTATGSVVYSNASTLRIANYSTGAIHHSDYKFKSGINYLVWYMGWN